MHWLIIAHSAALFAAGTLAASGPEAKPALHVEQTATINVAAPVEKVFPLFGPVEEARWADGWAPEVLYQGKNMEGTVFATRAPHPGFWVLALWDEAGHRVRYAEVVPERYVVQIDIACRAASAAATRCQVTYSYTSLGADGDAFLRQYTSEHHAQRIGQWERALNHYLQTGERLAGHE